MADSTGVETPAIPWPPTSLRSLLAGDYDWRYFFWLLSPYRQSRDSKGTRETRKYLRFVRSDECIPLLVVIFGGLLHLTAAFCHVFMPAAIFQSFPFAPFGDYMPQAAFIISALGTLLHCMKIRLPGTPYQIGSGMGSMLGNSMIVGMVFLQLMIRIVEEEGGSFHDAYGKVLGTSAVCSIALIALAFVPRRFVKPAFPPLVCGLIITLIGIDITKPGVQFWGGGADCAGTDHLCVSDGNVQLPYGSPEYLGLGVLTFVTFLVLELFGSAFVRHNNIILSVAICFLVSMLLTKDERRYVTGSHIEESHPLHFLWVNTYKLGFYGGAVLPLLGVFLVTYLQATAVLTATAEESRIDIASAEADQNIQGGLITTALVTLFSVLATGMPVMPVAPSSSVPTFSGIASRYIAMGGAFWFFLIGVLGHAMGASLESPAGIYGGIQIPLAVGVIITGLKILSREQWTRRNVMISAYALSVGLAPILVPSVVSDALWRLGDNPSGFEKSVRLAVITVMQVPYFLGGLTAIALHFLLPQDLSMEPEQRANVNSTARAETADVVGEVSDAGPLRAALLDEAEVL